MPDPDKIITPDEIQGAPRRTGRFWFDFLAASAAIFISLVSLVIGIRGEGVQRELLAANSWPFMEVDEERRISGNNAAVVVNVRNEGVGPAKVMSFEVFYQGKPAGDATQLLQSCCGLPADTKAAHARMALGIGLGDVAGNVIRPDQSRTMISMDHRFADAGVFDAFDAHLSEITFRLCYCSILDRCWISDLRTLKPAEVASCPVPAHAFSMINLADH